jgi:hypothetical protein
MKIIDAIAVELLITDFSSIKTTIKRSLK